MTTKEWHLEGHSWFQKWCRFRDGKLFLVDRDNKDQYDTEHEVDIAAFIREHAGNRESPYPDIVAFLRSETGLGD